ncbi:taurine ABC transporter ATP-binding protein [Candidatus Epulonipiscium fishelsonii]|uniref:Taurine ABC transporter ATP-binding protein n=1 Tax=Candidatus Epulonipiscium fishelsonii TaxID=77094 RepID=A0ACC8XEV9_9FIRM|nr:taurine ABC transporter ATP-binding protein [Epulopiscium sp. SCG-B11WGA-EpuloA1]ONI43720.1 taurine ABC transporter ATP-binding protein [Epulopiscium sp. SCG-B05WGA-EpuloA1]
MSNIIEFKNVYKSFYTKEGEIAVIENLNLTLEKGKILGLLGPSGSGKSTILNMVTNLIEPTSGKIEVNGKIGYMFQKDNLLDWRTIKDNIMIGLEIQHKINNEALSKIDRLLKIYDLWEFRNRFPRELSGGMRQRVALIRTLATDPDILLLDEPFSALDYQTRLIVSDDIHRIIKQENKDAILVTHDISEGIAICDTVCVLSKRPATIKQTYNIKLTINEETATKNERTPMNSRNAPEFKTYFDLVWKELEVYAK